MSLIFQPTVFQQQIVPRVAGVDYCATTKAALPTGGLVFAYDFGCVDCWGGSGRTVTDLSGNALTGRLTGSIDSSSFGGTNVGLSFSGTGAVLEVGTASTLSTYWNNNKNLMIGVQYLQTSSFGKNISFASTWDTVSGGYNAGYIFFLDVLSGGGLDTGVQLYGASTLGFYNNSGTATTGTDPRTAVMRAISNDVKVFINNSQQQSYTTNADRAFYYGTANADYGKVIRIGNRVASEHYTGRIMRVACYNTTDTSASQLHTWLSQTI